MAVRYSGEVEVRVTYDSRSRSYRGLVSGPRIRMPLEVFLAPDGDPRSSERYDAAARKMVEAVSRRFGRTAGAEVDGHGRPKVSREFEAPCPTGTTVSNDERRYACSGCLRRKLRRRRR